MAQAWSEKEVEIIVADYFAMLEAQIRQQRYNKTEHRRGLREHLVDRTDGSVERKHQNISAIMLELGIPYINGYKPLRNYQRALLPDAVLSYLSGHPEMTRLLETDVTADTDIPTVDDILSVIDTPPERHEVSGAGEVAERPTCGGVYIDYIQREARNQKLGCAGELFVINFEKARLIRAGRDSLADKIEHTAREAGDAAGFDIHSYEEAGTDRFIEAKTTRYGKEMPFYVTRNELNFSNQHQDKYWLYRVFRFCDSPRLYVANGSLERRFTLQPTVFLASA